jgi:hypothetical protein
MKILMWIGIIFLVLFVVYVIVFSAFAFYVSNPSTHNATAYNSKLSEQYYLQDGKATFVRNGNFFQLGGVAIEGADPDTFEVIDDAYARDAHHVYYNGKPITGANPNLVALDANTRDTGYIISDDKVFCYGELIKGVDTASFTYLFGSYAMDKDYIYYYIDIKIPRTTTPKMISNTNHAYIQHGEQIFYHGEAISNQASHFTIINDEYAKDSVNVFSRGKIIEGMDAQTFTILTPYYRKDKNQAYYFDTPIPGSDAATFKVLNDAITKDKNHLYYNGNIIENKKLSEVSNSDAAELQKIGKWKSLHLDANTVIMVPSFDIEDITNNFYVYQNEVYTRDRKLTGVKPEDVIILDEEEKEFARIGNQVFYHHIVIPDADPNTFHLLESRFSKDAKHVFWGEHKVVDANPLTFQYEQGLYAEENQAGEYFLKISED